MWSPLWSPVVATGGERLQMARAGTGQKQAKTVAVGCNQLSPGPHGKEGVDGSSPSEGSAKAPHMALFLSDQLAPGSGDTLGIAGGRDAGTAAPASRPAH